MGRKLRLGVIGAGSWTVASHLPNLDARRSDVEFVGVCRKGPAILEQIREDWGFAMASEDYVDVLDAGVDIVVVGSPTSSHYEQAKAAVEAGAHVLVEKPFTLTAAEAWSLVATAKGADRHIVVSYGFNYRPLAVEAERLMHEIGLGEVESQTIYMSSVTRELLAATGAYPLASKQAAPETRTWTDPAVSGGGYAQAQLTHALGLALRLTGLAATEVFAVMSAPHGEPVEIYDAMAIRYASGAIGSVSGAASHARPQGGGDHLEIRIMGSEGELEVDFQRDSVSLYRPDGHGASPAMAPGTGTYDCAGPPHTLVDLALGETTINRSPGELGARTVEILEAAYASARSNLPVPVEPKRFR